MSLEKASRITIAGVIKMKSMVSNGEYPFQIIEEKEQYIFHYPKGGYPLMVRLAISGNTIEVILERNESRETFETGYKLYVNGFELSTKRVLSKDNLNCAADFASEVAKALRKLESL